MKARSSPPESSFDRVRATTAVVAALGLGLALASIDILLAVLLDAPGGLARWEDLVASFAATANVVALGVLACWLLSTALLPLSAHCVLGATSVLSVAALLTVSFHPTPARILRSPLSPGSILIFVGAGLTLFGSYHLVERILSREATGPRLERWLRIAPVLLTEMAILTWFVTYVRWRGVLPVLGFLTGIAVTLMLLLRVSPGKRVTGLFTLFLLVTAAGTFSLYSRDPSAVAGASTFSPRSAHPIPYVILLSIDTLRADALSSYNPMARPTPNIDRLARDSLLFERAYSAGSWTLPSVASLLTGVPTFVHEMRNPHSTLPDALPTLAERMRDAGYVTSAIVENVYLEPQSGFVRGFLEYLYFPQPARGRTFGLRVLHRALPSKYPRGGTARVGALAQNWVEQNRDRDFFLWIHQLDPHVPYSPPAYFLPDAAPEPTIGSSFGDAPFVRAGLKLSQAERAWLEELYLAEVQFVDELVGDFIGRLEELGIYDQSLIVLTSDHGEEFWEHGGYEHGHSLFDEVVSVPLLVKLPRSKRTGRVEAPVSNQSVMSTILALTGVENPDSCFEAPALVSPGADEEAADGGEVLVSAGTLYFEDKEAILFDGFKFTSSLASNREELYDLGKDPRESRSILELAPEIAAQGRTLLHQQHERFDRVRRCYGITETAEREMDEETLRRLRALGYVHPDTER